MNSARIRQNKLYVIRGRGVARCVRSGDMTSRPTMLWVHEDPVAPDDVMREACKDDVPVRLHTIFFDNSDDPTVPHDAESLA